MSSCQKSPVTGIIKVGGDVEKYGCNPSTGYQWSIIRNACIVPWITGIRLNPTPLAIARGKNASLSIFAVLEHRSGTIIEIPDMPNTGIQNRKIEIIESDNRTIFTLASSNNEISSWKNGAYEITLAKSGTKSFILTYLFDNIEFYISAPFTFTDLNQ